MDINKVDNSFRSALSSTQKADCDHQFKQIFDQKMDELKGAESVSCIDQKRNVMVQSEKILNLLDDYAGELADPSRTLKDIRPLVDSIEKEVSLMESEAVNKVQDDKALDSLVKDLAVTAKVAMYKFHRGDYI